jgi:hypothetical protein
MRAFPHIGPKGFIWSRVSHRPALLIMEYKGTQAPGFKIPQVMIHDDTRGGSKTPTPLNLFRYLFLFIFSFTMNVKTLIAFWGVGDPKLGATTPGMKPV